MSLPLRRVVARRLGLEGELGNETALLRRLAQDLNQTRRRAGEADAPSVVHAGDLQAAAVLTELLAESLRGHFDAVTLEPFLTEDQLEAVLGRFDDEFLGAELSGDRATTERARRKLLEQLLLVWLLNRNPALAAIRELFDDEELAVEPLYERVASLLGQEVEDNVDGEPQGLLELTQADSGSLREQLDYVLDSWSDLSPELHERVLRARDALAEDEVRPPPGPGPAAPPALPAGPAHQPLARRVEPQWMREVVVVAKNALVWLHQLRTPGGPPLRLDQVPIAELERLRETGVSALWLIGVWRRSPASRLIKRRAGARPVASAYSVFEYRVADDLGGDEALDALLEKAGSVGLRLGVDVVPNHMGIDSAWVREHPDRFVWSSEPPFPNYRFEGPDLSGDPRFGIYLEEHYWDRSDAAVVFLRVDRRTGERRYVYHGNDGTGTPWNDTAQLDYSLRDVRRSMAEVIVDLARRFPLLRFDAAMTLTREHFQRLWYPAPGTGGAIPSRSERGLSHEEFARRMPVEFWRQVCDMVLEECPDTLLLAEAFWLMEGYFLRELNMARVYNSAFMRLLHERDNRTFRGMLRDTLAHDPRVLERYANFLTNPDEATAAEQFGRADRYFGACTLLAALPGMPLLGHGQIDGLVERYGMDFDKPERRESTDRAMLARHLREIAPLLEQRERFADASNMQLLALRDSAGAVIDDVVAWRGGSARDPAIVLFNNGETARHGALRPDRGANATPSRSLLDILGLERSPGRGVFTCRDERTGKVLTRPAQVVESEGLQLSLQPWESAVLGGFRLAVD